MSSPSIENTLQPLITCGALALLGLYAYAYQTGRHETLQVPPCSVSYKVLEEDHHDERVSLDTLMRKRDSFLHYMTDHDRIHETKPASPGGPQTHPLLDSLLNDMYDM